MPILGIFSDHIAMDNVVVVSYLPKTFANKTVEQYFKDAGDVLSVEKVTSGTAFVTFKTHDGKY